MRRTISTSTQAASIVVQGAYEKFCSPENQTVYLVDDRNGAVVSSYAPAAFEATCEEWVRFQGLIETWRHERGAMSSITEAAMCQAYQSIIGMGEVAIPYIMATLQAEGDEPDQWFWALKAITGCDPVDATDRGNYRAMADAWLSWGKSFGYAR